MTNHREPTRREVLGWAAGTAGGLGLFGCAGNDDGGRASEGSSSTTAPRPVPTSPTPVDDRLLVVIEMVGGNDGMSTLVPFENGRYRDARPTTSVPESDLIDLGGGFGLNSGLAVLRERGLAIVDGIGPRESTLSHFDMMAKWALGGSGAAARAGTGYLGRLCDRLAGDGELVGVSISAYPSRAVACAKRTAVTLASGSPLPPINGATPSSTALLRSALGAMSGAAGPGRTLDARDGLGQMLAVDSFVADLPPPTGITFDGGPGDTFKRQLELALRLISANRGVRVLHIPMGYADFDTHDIHLYRYAVLMHTLATGLEQFRAALGAAGLADRTLIATTSEFGRRVEENQGGLDHGAASCALMMGPVRNGVHGEHPSLRRLDENGNLRPTVPMSRYLSTMVAWMGVDPASVLDGDVRPLTDVVAV